MSEVNKEIEEMLNALGDPTPESAKVEEEEEKQEELPPKEEEEVPPKEEEGEETPPKEEETPPEEEETDKDKIIENLRNQLNERRVEESPKEEEKKEEEPPPKKEEPLTLEEQDFIGDADPEDIIRDKVALNKLLNTVYSKGVNDSKRIATEGVLSTIPDIVKHNVTIITQLKEASEKFYTDNKDLVPFKNVVATVFEEVASKNPDKKYNELMNLVAPEARKRLNLQKQAVKEEKKEEERKGPRLPNAKGGNRQLPNEKPNTSAISKEIEEMNKTLGR